MILKTEEMTLLIGTKTICERINFTLKSAEIWGILGPNGVGKTTLLRSLAGLYHPSNGSVFINENNILSIKKRALAQLIGILFQDFHANFPQTVFDFCLMSRFPHLSFFGRATEKDRQIVHDSLAKMGLAHLKKCSILMLSGGEKRRLAIAALLTQAPKIYLLDEPTNHLDVHYQMQILQHFRALACQESASVVMVLHDVNHAQQFCERILLLFPDGKIKQGTTQEMLTEAHLTALYQHKMISVTQDDRVVWLPE